MIAKFCSWTGISHLVVEAIHLPELSLINAVLAFKHWLVMSTVHTAGKVLLLG